MFFRKFPVFSDTWNNTIFIIHHFSAWKETIFLIFQRILYCRKNTTSRFPLQFSTFSRIIRIYRDKKIQEQKGGIRMKDPERTSYLNKAKKFLSTPAGIALTLLCAAVFITGIVYLITTTKILYVAGTFCMRPQCCCWIFCRCCWHLLLFFFLNQ